MKTKRITTILGTWACLFLTIDLLPAQVPEIIDYQGQLTSTDADFNGTGQFEFALIGGGGGSYWSNDGTSTTGNEPKAAVSLTVTNGAYSVGLGDTAITNMKVVPYTVFNNTPVYLRVWFNDGVDGWVQIKPDQRIGSAGYAMVANKVAAGTVGSSELAPNLSLLGITKFSQEVSLPGTTSSTTGVIVLGGSPFLHDLGPSNTFLGTTAGNFTMTGTNNTAAGIGAEAAITSGFADTALGAFSLLAMTTGTANIAVGAYAGSNITTGNGNIDIGNAGLASDSQVIRIGATQTQTYLIGSTGVNGSLAVDDTAQNTGNINAYALTFGTASGEGVASDRSSSGVSPFDLELWTNFANRLEIQQNGNVGIGTTTPTQKLEVNGEYIVVDGNSGVKVYIGDDGSGNDVQIGSLNSNVTNVSCFNATTNQYMRLVCSSIQINGGSDLAEPFAITKLKNPVAEGNVVVIDDENPGHLTLTDRPYDTRVAGVVSGANGIHPGIQMRQQGLLEGDQNVALTGRVYVQADTSNGPIAPGDMLTTSGTPGVAMKVTDHLRAQGAILGKAMTSLKHGHGMVLVLVTLQ